MNDFPDAGLPPTSATMDDGAWVVGVSTDVEVELIAQLHDVGLVPRSFSAAEAAADVLADLAGLPQLVVLGDSLTESQVESWLVALHARGAEDAPAVIADVTLDVEQGDYPSPIVQVALPWGLADVPHVVGALAREPTSPPLVLAVGASSVETSKLGERLRTALSTTAVVIRTAEDASVDALADAARGAVDPHQVALIVFSASDSADVRRARRLAARLPPDQALVLWLDVPISDDAVLLQLLSGRLVDVLTPSADDLTVAVRLRGHMRRLAIEAHAQLMRSRLIESEARRHAAAEQQRLDARLRIALDAAEMGRLEWDLADRFSMTPAAALLLGGDVSQHALSFDAFIACFRESDQPMLRDVLGLVVKAARTPHASPPGVNVELALAPRNERDEQRFVSMHGQCVPEPPTGRLLCVLQDTTSRRRKEEALRRVAEYQRQIVGVVGHDLRNPLHAVVSGVELMADVVRDAPNADEVLPILTRVSSAATRGTRMVEDLLDYTRVQLGDGLVLDRRPTDVGRLVKQVVGEMHLLEAGEVEVAINDERPACIDADRVAQALTNLLANALAHGKKAAGVRCVVDGDADVLTITVENDGVLSLGPDEDARVLFEPFRRGSSRRRRRGLGLGLFIVDHIAKAHDGWVFAASEDGTVRFVLSFPRVAMGDGSSSG